MKWVVVLCVLVVLVIGYSLYAFYAKVQLSKQLVRVAVPYAKEGGAPTVLVIGDSTGVGVGATRAEDTVAALLATHLQVGGVENYSVSGARVADLPSQIANAKHGTYNTILVQIGGNDIIRFGGARSTAYKLQQILTTLPKHERLILMSAGNVGGATLFPFFIRPFHTALNQRYHTEFARVAAAMGGVYVNLYEPPATDPFVIDPDKYFAPDGLHPSSAGYAVWFEKLVKMLK